MTRPIALAIRKALKSAGFVVKYARHVADPDPAFDSGDPGWRIKVFGLGSSDTAQRIQAIAEACGAKDATVKFVRGEVVNGQV